MEEERVAALGRASSGEPVLIEGAPAVGPTKTTLRPQEHQVYGSPLRAGEAREPQKGGRVAHTTTDYGRAADRAEAPAGCVGYTVLDPEGRKIGVVGELFANGSGEPEYVRVKMGLFGLKSALIPVQLVALDSERRTMTLQ